jgi:hypothetical protein
MAKQEHPSVEEVVRNQKRGTKEMRMNCNLFRAIRHGYFMAMIRYCRAYGWKYLITDTFTK